MELDKHYNPTENEQTLIKEYSERYHSVPNDQEPYVIIMPPPNITGVLHMGHMLNLTIQDVLCRHARQMGKNVCWVPGLDHAAIATETKVIDKLKQLNIDKSQLSREEFLKYCWEWKNEYGNIILTQIKKLGVSCDWSRLLFTLDNQSQKGVLDTFINLYNKGYIYRDFRIINWDPVEKTALSDIEVIYKESKGKLFHLKYYLSDSNTDYLLVATSRPETIFGDVAICVNPEDIRYKHFIGKKVKVPIINRLIPVISDEYVDKDFGTGVLKITPAHDVNDYQLGKKYNLEFIEIIDENGLLTRNDCIPEQFQGLDRFIARKEIVKYLENNDYLEKIELYNTRIGYAERSGVVVEPRISKQWFVKMQELSIPAIKALKHGEIKFHPDKFDNTYYNWLENIKDWCISRQLWWGIRIPAFYTPEGNVIVAHDLQEAFSKAKINEPNIKIDDLHQDEDVLDTWFSSALWPLSVFNGVSRSLNNEDKENHDFLYYFPTCDLVTGPDIIFFWVTRMIIMSYYITNKPPFKNVYFTGIIRDNKGRKMSKSLGNSPDVLKLIDTYGSDAVRFGILLSTQAGNDLKYDEQLCIQGRNFTTKLWNALRFIAMQEDHLSEQSVDDNSVYNQMLETINNNEKLLEEKYVQYRINEAAMMVYKFIWDDFCSNYLEKIKVPKGQMMSKQVYNQTLDIYEKLIIMLSPFMPFITNLIIKKIKDLKR